MSRAFACTALGLFALAVGFWFLLIAPAEETAESIAGNAEAVVSIHRVLIGQTFSIIGAVFLAAAWRPRERLRA